MLLLGYHGESLARINGASESQYVACPEAYLAIAGSGGEGDAHIHQPVAETETADSLIYIEQAKFAETVSSVGKTYGSYTCAVAFCDPDTLSLQIIYLFLPHRVDIRL